MAGVLGVWLEIRKEMEKRLEVVVNALVGTGLGLG
jgi:hypothetical protein